MRRGCVRIAGVLILLIALAIALWLFWPPSDRLAADVSPEIQTLVSQPDVRVREVGQTTTAYGLFRRYATRTETDGQVHFDVNEQGEVVGFFREGQTSNTVVLSLEQARAIAQDFGRQHFPDPALLDNTPEVAELIDTQSDARYYRFVWQARDASTLAYLPQSLQIEVNAESGRVDAYTRLYEAIHLNLQPAITQTAAEVTAQETLATYVERLEIVETKLVVTRPVWQKGGGDQQLIWHIRLLGVPDQETGLTPGVSVFVDAMTGGILYVEPTP